MMLVSNKCLIYWIRFCCTFFVAYSTPVCIQNCGCGSCSSRTTQSHSPIPHHRQKSVPACAPHPGIIQTPSQHQLSKILSGQARFYTGHHHGVRLSCSNYLHDTEFLLLSFMFLPVAICSTLVLSMPSVIPLSLQFTTSCV